MQNEMKQEVHRIDKETVAPGYYADTFFSFQKYTSKGCDVYSKDTLQDNKNTLETITEKNNIGNNAMMKCNLEIFIRKQGMKNVLVTCSEKFCL